MVNELDEECNEGASHMVLKNTISLNISTELSVSLLESASPQDMSLLYFLGCLPSGLKEGQIIKIWDESIRQSIQNLEQLAFMEVGVDRIILTPYMLSYIEDTIDVKSKLIYMNIIIEFYTELLEHGYRCIGNKTAIMDAYEMDSVHTEIFCEEESEITSRMEYPSSPGILKKHASIELVFQDLGKQTDVNSKTKTIYD